MKHSENLQGRAAGLVDDQVGEDSIKQNRAAGEIGAPVPHPGHFGQPVKPLENVGDYPVRRFQAFAFQKVKPNGVDIENGIFGKLKWLQVVYRPKSERCACLMAASFRRASSGP